VRLVSLGKEVVVTRDRYCLSCAFRTPLTALLQLLVTQDNQEGSAVGTIGCEFRDLKKKGGRETPI